MYVPLNIKTDNTLLSSMIKIKDLIQVAKENKIRALTITDNNMFGVLEFYKECINNNIKPIIGLEIKIPDSIILYAKNYQGYLNLVKITTLISEENLTINNLKNHSENLIAIVPYTSKSIYREINKLFEYTFISYKNEEEKAKIKNPNIIYMSEILCLQKEDAKYLKYLYSIKEGKTLQKIDKTNVSLLPLEIPKEQNNEKICSLCNIEIKFHQNLIPKLPGDSYNNLKQKCIKSLKNKFGQSAPKKYIERLKHELKIIKEMGFCDYFLIVEDYVSYAKQNNILVGPGRGSAAGSLVAYLLNIITVDPLKYNLLFERFLNPERITMPDIDVDFEDNKRDLVCNYCIKKYGAKKVAPIITFGTLGPRQVIRDVGRVSSVSLQKIDILTKMIDPKISLKQNYKNNIKKYIENNPELKLIYKIALKFEGLKRHTSVHAAGIVMSNIELDKIIPLNKHSNFYTTGYDMTYLEELGLLKMDFLGLKNLTLISNILKDISGLSFDTIKENDKKSIDIFNKVNTIGIFQFESNGMMNFLNKFKILNFEDIVSAIALYRPGPMQNIDTFIRRKNKQEEIKYLHPDLKPILKSTYGIIIYQEQIMQIATTMAGYTMSKADNLRRAMSKKKESILLKEKDVFISQSIQKGYDKKIATEVYDLILKFASYGFNKSHSVAYATIAYKMAYLKAHYPVIFMKNLLSSAINSVSKTKEYIYECKKNNLIVLPPDINLSKENYIVINNKIIYPLTNIKNIGYTATKYILEERKKRNFKDIFDFVKRCLSKEVNQKTLETLILAGCFDKLGYNRKTLIDNIKAIINYSEIGELLEETLKPELELSKEYPKEVLLENENQIFGFYLTNHPVTSYRLNNRNIIDIKRINNYFGKTVITIVKVDKIKIIKTKKGDNMMFITASDELSQIDIIVFPDIYKTLSNFQIEDILQITGKVEKRYDKYQLIANNIKKMN